MNTDGTGFYTCKECHQTEFLWNHITTDHKEEEQLEDRRDVGENSCNSGDGMDQRLQSLMFMMMMMIYHIISYRIVLYHIVSYIISYHHIISYHIISYHIASYLDVTRVYAEFKLLLENIYYALTTCIVQVIFITWLLAVERKTSLLHYQPITLPHLLCWFLFNP